MYTVTMIEEELGEYKRETMSHGAHLFVQVWPLRGLFLTAKVMGQFRILGLNFHAGLLHVGDGTYLFVYLDVKKENHTSISQIMTFLINCTAS